MTGGTARGRRLFGVPGKDVRPALARMRTSLFEVLRSRLEGARVVDLFAGTGSLGLEALSRGAERALFLDADPRCLDVLRKNVDRLGFAGRAEVRRADAFAAVSTLEPADVAFVDPPYNFYLNRAEEMRTLIGALLSQVAAGPEARVIVEHRPREGPGAVEGGEIVDERTYGDTVVTPYRRA